MSNFTMQDYVNHFGAVKKAESTLESLKGKSADKHNGFMAFIGAVTNKAELLERALAELRKFDPSFTDGYQKAAKSGNNAAIAYNRFAAWTVTNVNPETGKVYTKEQKDQIKAENDNKKAATKNEEKEQIIAEATKGMISADSVKPLTIENCLAFLQSKGFKMTVKANKVTLVGTMAK